MLDEIRVVELGHLIAGPYCGLLFADHGADVIKVEPPGGELSRHRDPVCVRNQGEITAHYASMNRKKRSVTLDLKNVEGHELFLQLLSTADVLVTNMRPGALERLDLGLTRLHRDFPRLIIVAITGFGVEDTLGDERERAGLAVVAEAISGITNLAKDREGRPVWCGFALGDMVAGLTGFAAALVALIERQASEVGRVIDLALTDAILPLMSIAMAREQLADERTHAVSAHNDFHGVPYGVFQANDGFVSIGANTDQHWRLLCTAMGQPKLGDDPLYATFAARSARMDDVTCRVDNWTKALSRGEVVTMLNALDIPVAPVHTLPEVLESERYARRSMLVCVDDGVGGRLVLPSDPGARKQESIPVVPRLGEHTQAVALELLEDPAEVARLETSGAFGAKP